MNLYLDIETIPAGNEQHAILKEIHAKKIRDGKKVDGDFEAYLAATSFDGAFGQIICIGYAKDNKPAEVFYGEEKQVLKDFWAIAKNATRFIGFNVMDFDLRFIYQRSVVNGVQPTQNLPFARYRSDPIFDVMWEWRKWAREPSISLDALAKALGIPSSKNGGIEGKDVWKAYQEGRQAEIYQYCKRDVEVTRTIYKKMVFAEQDKLPFWMKTVLELEKEIEAIKARNRRVESDKKWETSWTRRIAVAVSTYLVVLLFFFVIKAEKPIISALVPAIGFLLSTVSIDILKNWWLKRKNEAR